MIQMDEVRVPRARVHGSPPEASDPSLSSLLWGVDWKEVLPYRLPDTEVTVRASRFGAVVGFVKGHFARIFEEDECSPFSQRSVSAEAKRRYYERVADVFVFDEADRAIALMMCAPTDWSTYYIRMAAVLPEYQRRTIVPTFILRICEILQGHGVERVEADASPSNFASTRGLSRMGFNVSGTSLTERWGAHVRFTKFLDPHCEETFLRQFCSGVRYQRPDLRPGQPAQPSADEQPRKGVTP